MPKWELLDGDTGARHSAARVHDLQPLAARCIARSIRFNRDVLWCDAWIVEAIIHVIVLVLVLFELPARVSVLSPEHNELVVRAPFSRRRGLATHAVGPIAPRSEALRIAIADFNHAKEAVRSALGSQL